METEEEKVERLRLEAEAAASQNQPATNTNGQPTNIEQLIQTTLGESNRREQAALQRVRELEDRIAAQNNTPSVNNQNLPAVTNEQFWANPVESLNALINSQVAPIIQTTAAMRRRDNYIALKNNYRAQYPAFAQIENIVDGFMEGQEPNNNNMIVAIQRAVGSLALSNPGMLNNQNNQQNGQPVVVNNQPAPINNTPTPRIPDSQAHLRSTPTPVNNGNNQPAKTRQLNEFERRLAKEAGMSDEKYLALLNGSNTVESWKEDKKK